MTFTIGATLALFNSLIVNLLAGRAQKNDVAVVCIALAEIGSVLAFTAFISLAAPESTPFWEFSSSAFRSAMHSPTIWQFFAELASFEQQNYHPAITFIAGYLALRFPAFLFELIAPSLRKRGETPKTAEVCTCCKRAD
jgi:hypothetical protein